MCSLETFRRIVIFEYNRIDSTMISRFLNQNDWPNVVILFSLMALASAHASQIFLLWDPCELCLRQREVYWAAIGIGILGLIWRRLRPARRMGFVQCIIIGVVFLTGVGVAGFHSGVEWGFWDYVCKAEGGVTAIAPGALDSPMPTASCKDPPFVFLGLSMAGWNVVAYAGLAIGSFLSAFGLMGEAKS